MNIMDHLLNKTIKVKVINYPKPKYAENKDTTRYFIRKELWRLGTKNIIRPLNNPITKGSW